MPVEEESARGVDCEPKPNSAGNQESPVPSLCVERHRFLGMASNPEHARSQAIARRAAFCCAAECQARKEFIVLTLGLDSTPLRSGRYCRFLREFQRRSDDAIMDTKGS